MNNKKIFVAGGAGFIGSHLIERLLQGGDKIKITVYDNFSSGKCRLTESSKNDPRLRLIQQDMKDLPQLIKAMEGQDLVFHFASNPDIAKAVTMPTIDFWEGTYLTQNLLEAMRLNQVKELIYASGSGVYGEAGQTSLQENFSPMQPISTYGASKLASEALISSYCHLFDMKAVVFRFANVVGPYQTHGVAYDFIHKLISNPSCLSILGDGRQSKAYIHVEDVINALLLIYQQGLATYDCFNVATADYLTVTDIADLVVEGLQLSGVKYQYQGGDRGWKGDIPLVRFDTAKIRSRGWSQQRTSREAMRASIEAMVSLA